jgi:hypothetical protein
VLAHCRVLDALYKGIEQPGIFTRDQMPHFAALFEEAIDLFHTDHERTYLGRSGTRRFKNRIKCVMLAQITWPGGWPSLHIDPFVGTFEVSSVLQLLNMPLAVPKSSLHEQYSCM